MDEEWPMVGPSEPTASLMLSKDHQCMESEMSRKKNQQQYENNGNAHEIDIQQSAKIFIHEKKNTIANLSR